MDQQAGTARDLWWVLAAVVGFVALTVWWLTQDTRVQDWDNGLHTLLAFTTRDELASGRLSAPFTDFNEAYPPFVHLVGALAVLVGGKHPASVIVGANVVFVPLLAISCFGIGRLVYGSSRAGLLAAVFALGTPMFVSMMHTFMIDPAQAAMVAASVWALLASRRFERVGVSAVAGVLIGLALLTKETSAIFLAGVVAMVVLRGGWRNPRGVLVAGALAALIAVPWYVYHYHDLRAIAQGQGSAAQWGSPRPLSVQGLTWYTWDALNIQFQATLFVFFAIGAVLALRDWVRRRSPTDLRPDLLVGAAVSYAGITLIGHKDPRFTLPMLVYVAVLGGGWIAVARPALRTAASVILVAVCAANLLATSTGVGRVVRFSLPGAPKTSQELARRVTLFDPGGYQRGGPQHDGDVAALMRELRRAGVRTVTVEASSQGLNDFTTYGVFVLAIQAGLSPATAYNPAGLGPRDAFLIRHTPQPDDPPPCQRLSDGSGIYVVLGPAMKPFAAYTFFCPTRRPRFYARTAPLPPAVVAQMETSLPEPYRSQMASVMAALHRHGFQRIEFDPVSSQVPYFAAYQLAAMAVAAGLRLTPSYVPASLGPRDVFLLRHVPAPGDPRPCAARFPDGSGLYIVVGSPLKPFRALTLYCPARR